jgi:hypothetical protein
MTHTKDKALKLALEALEENHHLIEEHERPEYLAHYDRVISAVSKALAAPVQEPVAWRNAALRVGEDLCSVGPFGYYDMTAEQWLDWALSVVTVHAPPAAQRQWVGLTTEEIYSCDETSGLPQHEITNADLQAFAYAIEAKLKEKNT